MNTGHVVCALLDLVHSQVSTLCVYSYSKSELLVFSVFLRFGLYLLTTQGFKFFFTLKKMMEIIHILGKIMQTV